MKSGLIRLLVVGMMVMGMSAMAKDAAGAAPKGKPMKGIVSAPAAGAAADVVGVLTVGTEKYDLTAATDAVKAEIKDAITKGTAATVIGEVKEKTIAVTKVTVDAAKKADKAK